MQFLADENFPRTSILRLREAGCDVAAIIEDSPGAKDRQVLEHAATENRLLLTFDRDYGELIFRRGFAAPAGIVYFRFVPDTPAEPADVLLEILSATDLSIEGKFTIIERGRVRQRPLPEQKG